MDALDSLQQWYLAQCDGIWEHTYGVQIYTNDNPGWSLYISLVGTPRATRPFTSISHMGHETEWFQCRRTEDHFEALGGPFMLPKLIRIFLDWAERPEP